MNYKNILKRETKVIAYVVIALTLVVIGASYALFLQVNNNSNNQVVEAGSLVIEYSGGNKINVEENAENNCLMPMSDEDGETNGCKYTLSITNRGTLPMVYDLLIYDEEIEGNQLVNHNAIKHTIKKQKGEKVEEVTSKKLISELEEKENKKVLEKSTIEVGETIAFTITIWIEETKGEMEVGNIVSLKLDVVGSVYEDNRYVEDILNGAEPVLKDGLIPVEIDDTGKVIKANLKSEWYSYEKKKWANAVILEDETITYNDGDIIPESNIESYFVWIPKYSYQLWDLGNYTGLTTIDTSKVHEIPIKFGLENTSDDNVGECTTPMTSGASGNCKIGDYMTPPAFITMETNGLWVGKFETGYKGATSTAAAQVNSSDSTKIQIKPNVYSWRNITIGNAFNASYNYKRELDSHMMKNTEWGAVAYLQHSVYGSATSVRINNNNAYITGYAGVEEPTLGYNGETSIEGNRNESTSLGSDGTYTINYLNPLSQVASTTGNYSGIYDMSGGAWEYVMGVRSSITSGSAGITTSINSKYYDVYGASSSDTDYKHRILGDGTTEFGPFQDFRDPDGNNRHKSSWYYDYAGFIHSANPWFNRGGNWYFGVTSGAFAFNHNTGGTNANISFRLVLAFRLHISKIILHYSKYLRI